VICLEYTVVDLFCYLAAYPVLPGLKTKVRVEKRCEVQQEDKKTEKENDGGVGILGIARHGGDSRGLWVL